MAASKQQFRETLWFKKGLLDSAPAKDGEDAAPVDTLPVEDRYLDDGSVTTEDSAMFSVRTGSTQYVPKMGVVESVALPHDGLGKLVGEMKRGRRAIVAVIGVAAACLIIAACIV